MHVLARFPRHIFLAICRLLHDHGADFNAKDEFGNTPLHLLPNWSVLAHFAPGYVHVDVFELLISYGANVNAQNKAGDIPLHFLICQSLHGRRDREGIKAIIQLLLQHGADVNIQNSDGDTPLHTLVTPCSHHGMIR